MDKIRMVEDIVHEYYVPAWIGAAGWISALMAVIGGLGAAAGGLFLARALAGTAKAYGASQSDLSALAASYLIAASLSVLALGSLVANLAGCRKHLQQLVALRLHDLRVEIPAPDGFPPDADDKTPPGSALPR
jgi:hypothetical protein